MKYSERGNYFYELQDRNIVGRLGRMFSEAGYHIRREDGKIFTDRYRLLGDSVWNYTNVLDGDDCYRWHNVMFEYLGFVPSNCQNCFKVVVRPKTIKQLFALLDLQIKLGRPSKCGIEIRNFVSGLYGGYFYNHGLDEGLACYRLVKEEMSKDPVLSSILDQKDECGIPIDILLKRGCTEFERACGRSDQWKVTEEQLKWEAKVNEFVAPIEFQPIPPHVVDDMHWRWILFACEHGDMTYKEFTDGKPIHTPVVTYHFLAEGLQMKTVQLKLDSSGECALQET